MVSEPLLLEKLPLMCNVSVVFYLFEKQKLVLKVIVLVKASHYLFREINLSQRKLILFKYLFCTGNRYRSISRDVTRNHRRHIEHISCCIISCKSIQTHAKTSKFFHRLEQKFNRFEYFQRVHESFKFSSLI